MSEATPHDIQELGGRYVIERELGQGGTSTVYLAHDRVYDRRVAVKVLRRELAISLGADRFLREIRVTARLNHPHIAPVIDSGVGDGWCYFVTTYLDGGTLRQRLEQERQLPVDDAIGIARVIASALDHAHARGVLHCDVKPENILFSNGEAILTDFGIARLFEAGHNGTTSTGIVRGTPAYMSPEQAGGEKGYDGRTDIYSLGCVLYEALAGVPAFVGATPQAVLAQRFLHAPRDLRVYRPTVPRHVEGAIARAMALSPHDRFSTAGDFAAALKTRADASVGVGDGHDSHVSPSASGSTAAVDAAPTGRWPLTRRRLTLGTAVVAVAVAAAIWVARPEGGWFSNDESARIASFDSAPTVVFPFARDSLRDAFSGEDLYLHDALARWRGLRVIDVPRARALYAQRDSVRFTAVDARRLARKVGARRYIWGRLVDRGGTPTIVASIYDARGEEEPLRTESVAIPAAGVRDSVFDYLASALAFGRSRAMGETGLAGTRSAAAKAAYSRGIAAVKEWDLTRADSAFADALVADPDYSQALLWRAQVAGWRSDTAPAWRELASDAVQRVGYLGARDGALARAIYFHSSGVFPKACPIYRQLAATDPQDFRAWFGLGECLRLDEVVIVDSTSKSGWRFRSSYGEALRAYYRAFSLLPSVSRAYRTHAFRPLQSLLFTLSTQLRPGHSEPDRSLFGAYPSWVDDSLAFVPYPLSVIAAPASPATPATVIQAIEHNRHLLRRIAETWAAALPRDPGMLEGLAIARDLEGDRSAISVMRQALDLSAGHDRVPLASTLVWLQVKHACVAADTGVLDTALLSTGRRLADSVLAGTRSPNDREVSYLLGLAALTGQASLGADLARRHAQPIIASIAGRLVTISPRIAGLTSAFLMYAAVGTPADSIIELARRADAAVHSDLSEDVWEEARRILFTRPVGLAFPVVGRVLTLDGEGRADYLLAAEDAVTGGRFGRAKEILKGVRAPRRHLRPADLRFDALYPEAWVLARTGDIAGALAWISPTLDALPSLPPQSIEDPASIGATVSSMKLRADLAATVGDSTAARLWGMCASILRR